MAKEKQWLCNDCKELEDGGECIVKTKWQIKPSACPMDGTKNVHFRKRSPESEASDE